MAESTIEWTTYTFNPWIGCEKVSAACKYCYAENETYARVSKARGLPLWGPGSSRHVTSDDNWRKPLSWNRAAAKAGQRSRVFCASLADVFEARSELDAERLRLFGLIESTPHLDWLLLTKRPENILGMVPPHWRGGFPLHVWAGTTAENNEMVRQRWTALAQVPARTRFLSMEPLLERTSLYCPGCGGSVADHLAPDQGGCGGLFPDWVIVGGESGPHARPFDTMWARQLIEQCRRARIACFVKQLGARPFQSLHMKSHRVESTDRSMRMVIGEATMSSAIELNDRKGGDWSEWPEDLREREFPEVHRG